MLWRDIQFRSLAQKVDALTKLRQGLGLPVEWLIEQYGLDPAEVERVMAMRRAEAELDPIGALSSAAGQRSGTAADGGRADHPDAAADEQ